MYVKLIQSKCEIFSCLEAAILNTWRPINLVYVKIWMSTEG